MSDLISRSELLKRLEEWNTSDETDKALYNFAFHRIIEQPTTYSVDKVVDELKTDSSVKLYGSGNSDNYLIPVKKAIEIVKQGGTSASYSIQDIDNAIRNKGLLQSE